MTAISYHAGKGVLAGVFGALFAAGHAHAATYTIVDLGTLGGSTSNTYGYSAINAAGQVVGESNTAGDATYHAFRTTANGTLNAAADLDLNPLIGPDSGASGINDSGQVVGYTYVDQTSHAHAFRTTANGKIDAASDLGTLYGLSSEAYGINASGQTVGYAVNASNGYTLAFRTTANGTINPAAALGTLGGSNSMAFAINASGQAVGRAQTTGDATSHAFRTTANGTINPASDLGTLGGSYSTATGINDAGQTVGNSYLTGDAVYHAFRTTANGTIDAASDLGTLGGSDSEAVTINNSGQVVGNSSIANDTGQHAFIVNGTGPMQDLNAMIPANSGWVLVSANGINDSGQIAGDGIAPNGQVHAFLLTPTPEPASLAILALREIKVTRTFSSQSASVMLPAMPRTARRTPGGIAYHVLNRANGRLRLFKKDEDFLAFERVLLEAYERTPIRILDWCLMPNHFHLVLWPEKDGELTTFMRWLTLTHAQRWKHAHAAVGHGHLYQGRFKSFPIEQDGHLAAVLRYVERNPLRAKLVKRAEQWRWGSCFVRQTRPHELRPLLADWPVPRPRDWLDRVNTPQTPAEEAAMKLHIGRGRPLGGDAWARRTAMTLGLGHTLRPRGRPKGWRKHRAEEPESL
jgi:putative transposase